MGALFFIPIIGLMGADSFQGCSREMRSAGLVSSHLDRYCRSTCAAMGSRNHSQFDSSTWDGGGRLLVATRHPA